ncbi:ligase-associated DNA damage response endonuclease PdeM [Oxalicibacterium faecigallinarum]|uniref:ligase-associated DNA damage response endonuclease PdeM n=1 Tax=Oxalicibacterium faecigallinarum TaxID=573741 RepID=UPI0035935A07
MTVAGHALTLLPQRALWWPQHGMLILADIHFGKAAAFRAQGVPVPRGTTSENLQSLDKLIARYAPRTVLFLGDFLHAATSHAAATLAALRQWRSRHPQLKLILVRGNHDLRAGDPPDDLEVEIIDEPLLIEGFAFCHHPQTLAGNYVIAGHLHPVFRIRSGRDSLRLPCFVFGEHGAILPSFGAFTGGFTMDAQAGEQIFIVVEQSVIRIPR